ncbi:MAG: 50S ribosomal protein L29 [Thaumarchaeota archaeon]|nr:50S ribosomal protein L29 [Nitrososphaerota archaeon]|tara:strand:- start:665 stop:871 length:207 start_codon:yes stop_codon:yes gene_type:complete
MGRVKLKDLREMNNGDLIGKLSELKADLGKLRVESAKGSLRKDSGKVRYRRRDIGRVLTILRERGTKI